MNDYFDIEGLLSNQDLRVVDAEEKSVDTDSSVQIKKPSVWKIIACALIGILFSFLIFVAVGSFYTEYIRFPAQEEVVYETTGMCAINAYEKLVHNQEGLTEEDYLIKEMGYANSNPDRLAFIKKIVNTVHYEPNIVNAKNVYGNDMIDRETMQVVTIPSYVKEDEEVNFTYVDYSSIVFNNTKIEDMVARYSLTEDNVDYANILVDMFCDYINNIDNLPTKTISRVPNITNVDGSYVMVADEDIYLDQLLFSSQALDDCMMRFTEAVNTAVTGEKLEPTEEWVVWNALSKAKKDVTAEPFKYGKLTMSRNWCGAYYLLNNNYVYDENGNKVKESLVPQLGDGSFESPASIGTPVISSVISIDSRGVVKELPIRVELTEFGSSESAISWFQSKHIQNRGYNLDSELQYCYCVFKITNLSDTMIVVNDNSSLCDKSGNLSTKTGTVYGLTSTLKLQPDEEGYIESWSNSTELNRKYLIWGADFDKKVEPVWFRVLSGDLEDKSENKGVHIISRGVTTDSSSNSSSRATETTS